MMGILSCMFTLVLVAATRAWPLDHVAEVKDIAGREVAQYLVRDSVQPARLNSTPAAIDCDVVDRWLQDLKGKSLPDVKGSKHEWFGTVKYQVTNLKVTSLSNATCDVKLHFLTVTVDISKLTIGAHGKWHYKVGSISDSGTVDVKVADISVEINVTDRSDPAADPPLSTNVIGEPHMTCHVTIAYIHISLHGGASWLYGSIIKKLEPSVKKQLETQICGMIYGRTVQARYDSPR